MSVNEKPKEPSSSEQMSLSYQLDPAKSGTENQKQPAGPRPQADVEQNWSWRAIRGTGPASLPTRQRIRHRTCFSQVPGSSLPLRPHRDGQGGCLAALFPRDPATSNHIPPCPGREQHPALPVRPGPRPLSRTNPARSPTALSPLKSRVEATTHILGFSPGCNPITTEMITGTPVIKLGATPADPVNSAPTEPSPRLPLHQPFLLLQV